MARFFCPQCGAKISHTARFCSQCGHRVSNKFDSADDVIVRCARCKGSGKLRSYNPPFGYVEQEKNICPACGGSGVQRV